MELDDALLVTLFPNVSTQLRSMLGNLHLAAAALAPAEAREENADLDAKAALLDQSYYQILRLVNNLTDTAQMINHEPFPLRDRDLVELMRAQCEQTESLAQLLGIHLHFVCDMESHFCAVYWEALQQLLFQLLSNALKFTADGGVITVELRVMGGRMLLSVIDNGCGISEELLPTLFDRYFHKDLMNPSPHGLGLGLSLCRYIAQKHDGHVMAESQPGKGSRVTLSIPDRLVGVSSVSDVTFDYTGGFNPILLALADALPPSAFLQKSLE